MCKAHSHKETQVTKEQRNASNQGPTPNSQSPRSPERQFFEVRPLGACDMPWAERGLRAGRALASHIPRQLPLSQSARPSGLHTENAADTKNARESEGGVSSFPRKNDDERLEPAYMPLTRNEPVTHGLSSSCLKKKRMPRDRSEAHGSV